MRNIKTSKQFIFFFIKPIWPLLRVVAIKIKIIDDIKERQRFEIGFLKDGFNIKEVEKHLASLGFFKEKMAFKDPDEILGMRKLDEENKTFQYHLRIYRDGEVRGHYEKTPEDFPIDHFKEIGFEDRKEYFLSALEKFI